jgi:hypothetical protein
MNREDRKKELKKIIGTEKLGHGEDIDFVVESMMLSSEITEFMYNYFDKSEEVDPRIIIGALSLVIVKACILADLDKSEFDRLNKKTSDHFYESTRLTKIKKHIEEMRGKNE